MSDEQRRAAERSIQKILIDLEEETNEEIDAVQVDTRNFASLRTEIFFAKDQQS